MAKKCNCSEKCECGCQQGKKCTCKGKCECGSKEKKTDKKCGRKKNN